MQSPTSRPPVQLATGPTAAVFTWNGDRWAHRITTGEATIWTSLDGPCPPANDPRWPASPVLVELSRVSVPRGDEAVSQAIVGVGLAGRSHFSASIASDPHDAGVIRFEIACRLHDPPVWIGSTYRQGDRLFRLTPLDDSTTLPRTVVWAYSIGPTGMTSVSGAAVSTSPA
ncbi:MAG: hypothetical protein NTY17_06865 [Planctomycetia bacterium]|nr:hypothetical protein [Planctomycetia bacterium]